MYANNNENNKSLTKANLNKYLNEVSKEYKRLGGRNHPIELILVGGASILENYTFREMTQDVDAYYPKNEIFKRAVNNVGDKYGLSNGWLNNDFLKSESFSEKLRLYSVPFKSFNQVLDVRTIEGAYLIAMKLVAGRNYKKDLSDIIGILSVYSENGNPLSFEDINNAMNNLYNGWENISKEMISFIKNVLDSKDYENLYMIINDYENDFRQFELNKSSTSDITVPQKTVSQVLNDYKKQPINNLNKKYKKHGLDLDK